MTRLSISRWSSLFFRFPSPISPQHSLGETDNHPIMANLSRSSQILFSVTADNQAHSLGEADLWLTPHRGREATGVVYHDPPNTASERLITTRFTQSRRKNTKITTKKHAKISTKKTRENQHEKNTKISTKKSQNSAQKNRKIQHKKGPTDVVDPLAVICKREILLFCCFFSLRSFNCFCLWS